MLLYADNIFAERLGRSDSNWLMHIWSSVQRQENDSEEKIKRCLLTNLYLNMQNALQYLKFFSTRKRKSFSFVRDIEANINWMVKSSEFQIYICAQKIIIIISGNQMQQYFQRTQQTLGFSSIMLS